MPPTVPLTVSDSDRLSLESLLSSPGLRQDHQRRIRVVLLAAEGVPAGDIARRLGVTEFAVCRIRRRFQQSGVAGLAGRPRRGRGNKLASEVERRVLAAARGAPPIGHSHWSTGLLASQTRLSRSAVHKILRTHGMAPQDQRASTMPSDPALLDRELDVVGLYMTGTRRAVVLSLDDLHHDSPCPCVLDLLASFEGPAPVEALASSSAGDADELLPFMRTLAKRFPSRDLSVLLDNSVSTTPDETMRWVDEHPRVTIHFAPSRQSWLRKVDDVFGAMTKSPSHLAPEEARAQVRHHMEAAVEAGSELRVPFIWTRASDRATP